MRWLEHIYHPFVAYLPIVGDILFRPWHFVRKVVERDDKFAKRLRGCSFFLASVYLIIQPYLLPKEVSAEPEGLVGHFKDDILMLALIAIFSAVFPIIERRNRDLNLDTFLNFTIPLLLVAVFVSTAIELIAQTRLESLGLSRVQMYVTCRGLFNYQCLSEIMPGNANEFYRFALANGLLEGHLKALVVAGYVVGLDPLRSRKNVPIESKAFRIGFVIFIYIGVQLFVLNSNGLFRK